MVKKASKHNVDENTLAERSGVAVGMENLARYILKRCDMISRTDSFKKKFRSHRVFTAFYIPRKLLEKYTTYPIPDDCEKLEVVCMEISDAYAGIDYNKYFGYMLKLPPKMFHGDSENNNEFLENLMHELTHFVNYNQKNKGGNVFGDREEIGEKTREIVKDLLYYFQDSEMNAHLTGFYYELKNRYTVYKDEESGKIWAQEKGKYGLGVSLKDLKHFSKKLGWKYMNSAINALKNENFPSKKCYDFSTFPKNGNKETKWGGYFGNDDYSNVYFAILFTLKRYGNGGEDVIKLPKYDFYFGPGKNKWNNGNYETEFNDTNVRELAMKYVLLKNKIRNQFFKKWEDFNYRANKIIYMWYEEEMEKTQGKTLFQNIVNESIQEGGNAVPSAQPVRGDLAGEIAKDVIQAVTSTFGCAAEPAGSTGKKGREMTSGDIDILLDLPWEKNPEVEQWVKESFPNCEMAVQPGFKQISFGYQYDEDGTPKVAQVDLMFTSNMNWRRWSAYSPSPYESKFKGLVQTVLLKLIARSKPIDKEKFPDEFYTAEDYGGGYEGVMKSHWRYMWDAEIGLVIVHRTNLGKKRPIKSYTIKEDTIVVTSNPDEAMKLIFGPEATLADMKSPETMVAFLFSGKYEYATPELLQRIHDGVIANKEMEKVPGAIENFEALWNEYAGKEQESQGAPAYSQAIQEIHDLYRRMKKTEE